MAYPRQVEFEWDDEKDFSNQQKHGLSFQEAQRLLDSGVDYLEIFDADHSELEDRFIAIGPVDDRLVVVWYTEPDEGVIRIIGARLASKRERELFRSRMDQER